MSATDVVTELNAALDLGLKWSDARCRDGSGATTGIFFSNEVSDIALAKAMCNECLYQRPCFEGALERGEGCGVWGGQLFADGQIVAHKRGRGRPPKNPPPQALLSA
jgi:WhiB family redox-sensing transcriptional regulator